MDELLFRIIKFIRVLRHSRHSDPQPSGNALSIGK
jgi:hypothetical protein